MTPTPIRVYLLDDHEVVRRGLRALLESAGDVVVIGESGSAVDATHRVPALSRTSSSSTYASPMAQASRSAARSVRSIRPSGR